MVSLLMNGDREPHRGNEDGRGPGDHRQRRLHSRNIAVAAALAILVVLFYIVAIVKMSGS